MSTHRLCLRAAAFAALATLAHAPAAHAQRADAAPAWPAITTDMRPWTRWWWQGSAVNPTDLTRNLEAYQRVGLGGVEVTPIYGVFGAEAEFIPYLSPKWVSMLEHTLTESKRLGIGVDMATGTGWPFGGPNVGDADAAKYVAWKRWTLRGGERLRDTIAYTPTMLVRSAARRPTSDDSKQVAVRDPIAATPNLQALALDQVRFAKPLPLVTVMAYSKTGDVVDVTKFVTAARTLDWSPPAGEWTIYAVFQGWHGKQVERAAPGGEGNVIDHFSRQAITDYLRRFDEAFRGRDVRVHGFFNDSYEVDDAFGEGDWTPRLFDEFKARRGYDLRRHLPALFDGGASDTGRRVLSDYRQTISDLVLDGFTKSWADWAHARGSVVRDQAHGSPSNILDLYAAVDVPETEGTELTRLKFATSAAHVAGKRLASAEAATWLTEHFVTKLTDVRAALDNFFLAGVNHIVYHGTAYSPASEPWPGRLFYAAVEFNPQNPWWRDFAELNGYAARVQSFMQSGQPDNDVLLYFPIFDRFAERPRARGREAAGSGFGMPGQTPAGGFTSQGFSAEGQTATLLDHFDAIPPYDSSAFRTAADRMIARGYMYDYASDKQLAATHVEGGRVVSSGDARYRVVLVPSSRFIPFETMEQLVRLARGGATVAFLGGLPEDVAGLNDLARRRARFAAAKAALAISNAERGGGPSVARKRIGAGTVLVGADVDSLLAAASAQREPAVDLGVKLIRRRERDGATYFIVNTSNKTVDGWVPLATTARSAAVYAAMHASSGMGRVRSTANGIEVYLQFPASASRIVRTYDRDVTGASWAYVERAGEPLGVHPSWTIEFLSGGPTLPAKVVGASNGSWTDLPGDDVKRFSGTARYRMEMPRPPKRPGITSWRLDLGTVHESARIVLNGQELGTFIGPWYRVDIADSAFREVNVVEIEVTNLMANRIADLDRRGVPWKKFYNVNFPPRLAANRGSEGLFSAASWAPLPSGLAGPVTLTPLKPKTF